MLRISKIEVQNFKSLVDFEIELPKFSCLIGLNGAGKSTVLQFIDFVSQLIRGDMTQWMSERRWKPADLKSKLTKKVNIEFAVYFDDEFGEAIGCWEATYSPAKHRCTKERLQVSTDVLEIVKDIIEIQEPPGERARSYPIAFDYQGSIVSALKEDLLTSALREFKETFKQIKSLDMLAPESLRQRTRESSGTLGLGGQNMAAVLHEMSDAKRLALIQDLQKVYPRLQWLHARSLRSGWKQIEISERLTGESKESPSAIVTEARHVNDGMLRLIAILAELQSEHGFLLFDEIENGINPELVEFVIDALVNTPKQVVVTTHSPMILNYLNDDNAREGVIYLYKTSNGHTRSIPFFSIPSLAEKLKVMGPGEAFVDTNLTELQAEIDGLAEVK